MAARSVSCLLALGFAASVPFIASNGTALARDVGGGAHPPPAPYGHGGHGAHPPPTTSTQPIGGSKSTCKPNGEGCGKKF